MISFWNWLPFLGGQDFINQLLEMYNRNTNNDKNEIAQKTAEFIDELKISNAF